MHVQKALHASLLATALFTATLGVATAQQDEGQNNNKCNGKKGRGCQIPEVPFTAVLPAAAAVGITGFYVIQRRRFRGEASVEDDRAARG